MVKPSRLIVSSIFFLAACAQGPEPAASDESSQELRSPKVDVEEKHDASPPLALMPVPERRETNPEHEVKKIPRHYGTPAPQQGSSVDTGALTLAAPIAGLSFDGVGNGFSGPSGTFAVNAAPPDTNGDVGPNHYVQIVNTDFAVFNKSGTVLFGPVPVNTLWSGFGGGCQTNNDGDPLAVYDPIADRWVISQFSVSTQPFLQCIAVSQTSDPTGAYFRYSFSYGTGFNDYPKMGVWPDAYYFTYNIFTNGQTFAGAKVCAMNRAAMLTGAAATQQCFNTSTSFGGLLPADLDGPNQPAAGEPNFVVGLGTTATTLAFWKFHVDWTNSANSTFTGPTTLTVASYAEACSGGTCIPQSGTTQKLDSLADRMMYRLQYRKTADGVEHLVTNHSVTAGTSTGVRWYEIRNPNTTPVIFQQGTFAPDSNYRWMGSAAMDGSGGIGLAYSISSSTTHPGLAYTGRAAGDAAGTMTAGEGTLFTGPGSQLTTLSRWGDYSNLAVDPTDDCTFWFTSEYIPANGTFNWHTRIGSFKLAGCGATADTTPPTTTITAPANGATVSGTTTVTATATDNVGVTRVEIYLDNALQLSCTASPCNFSWNTTTAANGAHTLNSKAFDAANNVGTSAAVSVTVNNVAPPPDTTPPTTSITAPAAGATVSGTTTVTATASDNVGVTRIEIDLDGALQVTCTASPCNFSWNTTTAANGAHTLSSQAFDAAGNVGTSASVGVTVNNTATCTTSSQLFGNPGFESGNVIWTSTPAVIDGTTGGSAPRTGTFKAWLDGYGTTHTDDLYQNVTIPAGACSAQLSFWLKITTAETTTTTAFDQLTVTVRNTAGTVLSTLATYSNLNKGTAYVQKTFDLSAFKGQTVRIQFHGTEDASLQTSFFIDDTAVNVTQ